MRKLFLLLIPALLAMPSSATAGELKLTIQNGLVTLIADEVPLSMIMAEWARIGQTRIVNGDKITTPVSLHLVDTPERKALDILLRTASGYMAAERPTPVASASMFDRIMILPTSRAPLNTGPAPAPQPTFVPRPIQAPPVPDIDDDEPMVRPPMGQPQPGVNQPTLPGQAPNAPLTAPRPGPLPQQAPQQPVPFGAPKPPGGGGPGGGPGGVPPGGGA